VIHLDLFSGIGGFAYAVDQVWDNVEHIFCEIDPYCQQVLKKHWKGVTIYGDIRELITDTENQRLEGASEIEKNEYSRWGHISLLTGGFPCQPFSQAGKRKGTSDNRYLWKEMLRVIQLTKPTWIIGENVGGLVTWNEGLVLEQVCTDLEAEGYEVQPFIIPACAVNAPHRRDRVWIVANRQIAKLTGNRSKQGGEQNRLTNKNSHAQDSIGQRSGGGMENSGQVLERQSTKTENEGPSWEENWLEVATELCSLDDGLPVELDEFKLTEAGHRVQQLKAYGNSIVPQVAIEIMKAIKEAHDPPQRV
jgi:DNA (cytosine-5)-methyltransferase 1